MPGELTLTFNYTLSSPKKEQAKMTFNFDSVYSLKSYIDDSDLTLKDQKDKIKFTFKRVVELNSEVGSHTYTEGTGRAHCTWGPTNPVKVTFEADIIKSDGTVHRKPFNDSIYSWAADINSGKLTKQKYTVCLCDTKKNTLFVLKNAIPIKAIIAKNPFKGSTNERLTFLAESIESGTTGVNSQENHVRVAFGRKINDTTSYGGKSFAGWHSFIASILNGSVSITTSADSDVTKKGATILKLSKNIKPLSIEKTAAGHEILTFRADDLKGAEAA